MDKEALEHRRRAWLFAHKVITLTRYLTEREGTDLMDVKTAEVTKAMGRPEGAELEAVQRFVQTVLHFMRGWGLYAACGCGYLSLRVGFDAQRDRALREGRDLTSFTPEDLDRCLEEYLAED